MGLNMSQTLQEQIAEANRKAGLSRQRVMGKKIHLQQTVEQQLELVCERSKESFAVAARYKGELPSDLYQALKLLFEAVKIVERRKSNG